MTSREKSPMLSLSYLLFFFIVSVDALTSSGNIIIMEYNDSPSKPWVAFPSGDNPEIFSFIWLDLTENHSHENLDIQSQVRSIMHAMKLFEDIDECERYVRLLGKDERIVLLVNGKLVAEICSRIHDLRQIIAIYVYSSETSEDNQYKKIKSIKSDLNELVVQIKLDHLKRKKLEEPLPITIFDHNQSTDRLTSNINTPFLHSQLFIHFLLQSKLTNEQITDNKKELIEFCRPEYQNNPNQLKILHEFEYNYSSSNVLWWYTLDSFLYQLLTKSLSMINIDVLYLFRFLIRDLIQQLNQYQSTSIKRVYRSYVVSNEEFRLLEDSMGKYLSINRFFSTLINRDSAMNYFHDGEQDSANSKKILFKIDADPRLSAIKPFANITVLSETAGEEEILFSLGSLFRLDSIHRGKNEIYTIQLTLCSEDHHHLKPIFDQIKHQYGDKEVNLLSFGNALRRMGKLDEAKKCYQRLLTDSTCDRDLISRSYHHLGRIAEAKGDYDTSLEYLHQSLEIKLKLMKSTDPSIAQSYNALGIVYQQKGDHDQALNAFNKALIIWRRAYGKNHPNVAGCYNNMGVVYKREKKYFEALECFQKALAIRERHPSASQHDLAGSHNNIGAVYGRLGHHDLSIEHYNLSLKIKSKYLPAQHPSMASTFENLGYVYENRGAYLQSLSYLEKAALIYRQSFPSEHPDVAQIEQSIERVSSKLL